MPIRELSQFLTEADIEGLRRSTETATGLPGSVYTDEDFWMLERRSYFPSRWMACAHEHDLANPGDAVPVRVAGFELILTRDSDNKIRAFHNICAHRSMPVLQDRQSAVSTIRCPWHCWTYNLRGQLVATPNLGGIHVGELEAFDRSELGLREVNCDSFLNLVFVNIDGKAPPLKEFLAPLQRRLADYELDLLRASGQSTGVVFEGNWKLVIEGGVEDYHLPWVHPQLGPHSGMFTPEWDDTDCYVGFSSQRPADDEPVSITGNPRQATAALPVFPHMATPTQDGLGPPGLILMVPPSAVFALMSNHVVTTLLIPLSVDRTEQRRSFMYLGDAASSSELAPARQAICDSWVAVGDQDLDLASALQRQHRLRTETDIPTRFSPHWEPAVHHFQNMVVNHLIAQSAESGDQLSS